MLSVDALKAMAKRRLNTFKCEPCGVTWAKTEGQHCWMCGRFGRKC